jgi:hypothetical protein
MFVYFSVETPLLVLMGHESVCVSFAYTMYRCTDGDVIQLYMIEVTKRGNKQRPLWSQTKTIGLENNVNRWQLKNIDVPLDWYGATRVSD